MKTKTMTLAEVKARIKGLSLEQKKAMVCALVGHSLITTACFGYVYCARCDAQIADQLGGGFANAEKSVRVGHKCKTCRKNYAAMEWKDRFLAPDPFAKAKP
jgi:hypothetical protein